MDELGERKEKILNAIIQNYLETGEPVGSRTISKMSDLNLSSATIRNEMAKLEKFGLLEKTHTSSGRVPSQMGYRYYVEHLMVTDLDLPTKNSLQQVFSERHFSLEEVVDKSCAMLSDMTNLTSIVLGPDGSKQTLQNVQMVPINTKSAVAIIVTDSGHVENKIFTFKQDVTAKDLEVCCDIFNQQLKGTPISEVVVKMEEIKPLMSARISRSEVLFEAFVTAFMKFATEKVAVHGRSNMLYQPEFSDLDKLRELMSVLENGDVFHKWTDQAGNVAIHVGERNEVLQIGDVSVISTKFHCKNDEEGQLMVVGPNRMQYSKVVALMDYMSDVIEEVFMEGGNEDE